MKLREIPPELWMLAVALLAAMVYAALAVHVRTEW